VHLHVHSRVLADPVWTMRVLMLDARAADRRVAMKPSIRGSLAHGYERHAPPGSAAYGPCDAMTGPNMIQEGPPNRHPWMTEASVTSR
jgi:hypothetical protein